MTFLPKVSCDTGHSVAHYLNKYNNSESDLTMLSEELDLIAEENPAIAELIQLWSEKEDDTSNIVHTAMCGIMVYRLLRSQAEADQMAAEFKYQ